MCIQQALDSLVLGIEADIQSIRDVEDAVFTPGRVNVIDLALLPEDLPWGQLSPVAGHAAYEYIRVMQGRESASFMTAHDPDGPAGKARSSHAPQVFE